MVKMKAHGTIGLPRKVRDANSSIPNDRPVYDTVHIAPGTEFDTADYPNLTDADIALLEEQHRTAAGSAVRVSNSANPREERPVPVAANTAPRGPFSGQTSAPDPDEVGRAARGEERHDIKRGGDDTLDYEAMTRAELDAEAERRGIDVSRARTKADVIAALRA